MIKKQANRFINLNRKKKKRIFLAAALACLIMAACYTVFIQPLLKKDKWMYKEETVAKGTLTVGVTESGSLEYGITSQYYDLNLTVGSDEDEDDEEDGDETTEKYLKVEEVYVAAGQRISQGDALLKFTEDSVSDVRRLLTAALTDAQVSYSEARSEYSLSELQAQLDYEAEQVSGKYAKSIYGYTYQSVADSIQEKRLEIQALENKREALQESYEEAQESYEEALEAYETAKGDLENIGTGNEHVYVTFQSKYINAKSRYESALNRLNQALESIESNEEQIAGLQKETEQASAKQAIEQLEAKQEYEDGTLSSRNAQVSYTAELESLKEELEEALEELEAIQEQVDAFEAFVGSDGVVYAGGSGIVTEVGFKAGDSLVMSGVLVSYAPADRMQITVDVSQEDITSLSVGDSVEIEFKAYEGKKYEGVIASIVTTSTSEGSATVSYPVTIDVQGDTEGLFGGMTADVTFVTESKEDVLYVSRKAIVEENGKSYVYVDNSLGRKVLQEVSVGLGNGVNVEITEGLKEGDTIYIAGKVSSEADAAGTDTDSGSSEGSRGNSQDNSTFDMEMQWDGTQTDMPAGMQGVQIPDGGMQSVPGGNMGGMP